MSEWKSIQLGDHAEVLSGFPFPSEGFSQEEGVPLIRIRDLLAGELETYFIGPYPDDFVIDDGDTLIGMDGDFNIIRWAKGKALLNQRVCKVFTSTAELDDGYLFWLLEPELQDIHQKTPQTTVKHLSVRDLAQLRLEVPPVDEQRLIAHILDTLDTQIQKTEALIAKLEKVKEGLLHDLLTRGIDEHGQLRPSPEQAPELYKESPLGLIPREWGMHTTGELSTSIVPGRDKPILSTSGLPWITISDLTEKVVKKSRHGLCVPLDEAKKSSLRSIPKDCIIMSCVGEFGIASVSGCDAVINQQLHCFIPNPGINEFWLMYSLRLKGEEIEKMATQTTIKYLNKTGCESISLPTPTGAEQNRIMSAISIFDDRLLREETLLKKMRDKKTGLMDDLLTGRVRVTPLLDQDQAITPA